MRIKKNRKPLVREGICPICSRPLDKYQGQEICTHCNYIGLIKNAGIERVVSR